MRLSRNNQAAFAIVYVVAFAFVVFGFTNWYQSRNDAGALDLTGATYYVSPTGNDLNPGTATQPWKSFYKAAQTLKAGETAVFEDGTYIETQQTRVSLNAGTALAPITFKARNKHKAVILYRNQPGLKLHVSKPYVTVQDFEITQEVKGTTTGDKIAECGYQNDHCSFIGNKIHNAYEDCIKGADTTNFKVEGNICYDIVHEGIDLVNGSNILLKNNEIYNVGRIGIMAKGGIQDVQIVGNYIHTTAAMDSGIAVGGVTAAQWTADATTAGYEAYNVAAWSNSVISETPGLMYSALQVVGGTDCAFFNNVVVGAKYAMYTRKGGDLPSGWAWQPLVRNARFLNNVVMNSSVVGRFDDIQSGLQHDYNLFYNNAAGLQEEHAITADPLFTDPLRDWHAKPGSPLFDHGTVVAFASSTGSQVDVSLDSTGRVRTSPWDIGVYEDYPVVASPSPTPVVSSPSPSPSPVIASPSPSKVASPSPSPSPKNNKGGKRR